MLIRRSLKYVRAVNYKNLSFAADTGLSTQTLKFRLFTFAF